MIEGIQEYVTYINCKTLERDLFCANCGQLIKMNYGLKTVEEIECKECGVVNKFDLKSPIRRFNIKRMYSHIHPISYWAKKYGIPPNSCYMAFRRRGHGIHKHAIGGAYKMNHREFLASIVYTRRGQHILHQLIRNGNLLTDEEIKLSLEEHQGSNSLL